MLLFEGRAIPEIYEEYITNGASDHDQQILVREGFLKAIGTIEIKKTTSVATFRTTIYVRSLNTQETKELVKTVLAEYWQLCYGFAGVLFYQSQQEQRASKEDVMYFHGICFINADDYERMKSLNQR